MAGHINGNTLIQWGFSPGKWFTEGIKVANEMQAAGSDHDAIFATLQTMVPVEIGMRTNSLPYGVFLEPENDMEKANLASVNAHMDALMRVPTIVAGAVMPDACPSGSQEGTIPVGGAIAAKDAIHPGFHSADICCSVAITVFKRADDLKRMLDIAEQVTHFGPTARKKGMKASKGLKAKFAANRFLKDLDPDYHMGTQGDGNHFLYVGTLASTGQPCIVTHHGSRGLGATLYKRGMQVAKKHTSIIAPRIPAHQSWIKADSADGEAYWEALQLIRLWTKENHFIIHDTIAKLIGNAVVDRFWNEHNFVFQKSDGLFYHGKGATPSWKGFSADDDGRTLIPLNMAEPILITGHRDHKQSLGFAPHGAGRNMGRKAFLRGQEEELKVPEGIDLRSYCGKVDFSELPQAYKNAASVRRQIEKFDLATVIDEVLPYGSIMAGDWEADAPWRKK